MLEFLGFVIFPHAILLKIVPHTVPGAFQRKYLMLVKVWLNFGTWGAVRDSCVLWLVCCYKSIFKPLSAFLFMNHIEVVTSPKDTFVEGPQVTNIILWSACRLHQNTLYLHVGFPTV